MKHGINHTPVSYPPGKPGLALVRLKKRKTRPLPKLVSRQHKPLWNNDQLPLPGFD